MATLGSLDAVNRVTESVDDTTKEAGADRDIDNLASTFYGVTLLNEMIVTENGDTNIVSFQVQAHDTDTRGEFHHLFGWSYVGE